MKIKQLCTLKKSDIDVHTKKLIKILKKPKFICTKCARVAKDKEYLCHPLTMKS